MHAGAPIGALPSYRSWPRRGPPVRSCPELACRRNATRCEVMAVTGESRMGWTGVPGRARTCDLRFRKPPLEFVRGEKGVAYGGGVNVVHS